MSAEALGEEVVVIVDDVGGDDESISISGGRANIAQSVFGGGREKNGIAINLNGMVSFSGAVVEVEGGRR